MITGIMDKAMLTPMKKIILIVTDIVWHGVSGG